MYPRILVPVDGSDASAAALNEALRLARGHRAELLLLHIVRAPIFDYAFSPTDSSRREIVAALSKIGKSILGKAETAVREQGLIPQCLLIESVAGSAAAVILAQARQWPADLIVMGIHPRGGPKAVGSDTAEVLSGAPVPVLLVRAPVESAENAQRQSTVHRELEYESAAAGTTAVGP